MPYISARLQLTLSYAVFVVLVGGSMLVGIYLVLRYAPNYLFLAIQPRDDQGVIASRREIGSALVGASAVILTALAVLGIGGGWLLSGWILRPFKQLNEAARIAATGRLDYRINLSGRNDEFRQLADTFDIMLDRLQDAFATQERFAANASHELRTPLTVMGTMLEVARADPAGQDYPTLVERLSITNARAIGLTEALLRLADANAITAVAQPVDLAEIVGAVLAEHTAEVAQRQIAVTSRLESAPTLADTTLLSQLVTNLVQNALRHNHPDGQSWVSTGHDPRRAMVSLRIENTGTIVPAALAARLSEPFLRGAGRVSQRGQERGYGLGLALVARIVEVHRGTLAIEPRPDGGLIVTVELPSLSRATR